MKIIFFGTSGFAIPSLRMLAEHKHAPVAIIAAPDKPKGRGKRLTFTPVKQFVIEKIDKPGLSIFSITNCLTGVKVNRLPRPLGLSGAVIMATGACLCSASMRKEGIANPDVPKKIIFMNQLFLYSPLCR